MHPLAWLAYDAVARLADGLVAVAPAGDSKLVRTFHRRRGLLTRYERWGREHRVAARPLLWMHAPSVGEGLQARPVLELVRQRRPELQLAYTHFSPSAEAFAAGLSVDFRDYLPFDTEPGVRRVLDALRPNALVFAKLDVWPRLVQAATQRGIPVGMVSATLPPSSSRRQGLAGGLLRETYASLTLVGAIDAEDAGRLVDLGVRPGAIEVTGDTRYDQVWARAAAADRNGSLLAPLRSERPTLVAGSTWPSDETALLAAWLAVRAGQAESRLIIAPHEPTASHLAPIERWAQGHGLTLARLGTAEASRAEIVLVDRVGVLGELYALADVAFVGGGFHQAGLHSVLEPAAYGAPVIFGPHHAGSRDAGLLVAAEGAYSVHDSATLAARLGELLGTPGARQAAGDRALEVVRGGLGAADRSYSLVNRLLGGCRSRLAGAAMPR